MEFSINGIKWTVCFVQPDSDMLRRSDGSITCGMTDGETGMIYLSGSLQGAFLRKVLCHELTHAFMIAYDLHIPIPQEEYLADFIATYGTDLICLLDDLMQNILWKVA